MSRPWKQLRNLTVSETNNSPVNTLNTKATRSIIVSLNSSWPTVVSQHSEPPNITEDKLETNRYLVHVYKPCPWWLISIIWVVRLNVLSEFLYHHENSALEELILLFHSSKSSKKRSLVEKTKTYVFRISVYNLKRIKMLMHEWKYKRNEKWCEKNNKPRIQFSYSIFVNC